MWKTKASKDIALSNSKAIEKIRDQLDNAMVLLIEWIKNNIVWNGETKHAQINKNASTLQQLGALYKWINEEYLHETSITDQIENISRHTKDITNTILPVTANKLFWRRNSQHMPSYRSHSIEIDLEKSKVSSRNKFAQSIMSSKPKTTLMRFNFNEGFDKFKSVPLKTAKHSHAPLSTTSRNRGLHSKSRSPTSNEKNNLNTTKIALKSNLPKLDISLLTKIKKNKVLTSKSKPKNRVSSKFKEFIDQRF